MYFQCSNCGANMVYAPKKKAMFCPACDSVDSHKQVSEESMSNCPTCGGVLTIEQFDSSTKCPYCDNYLIFEERVTGEYKPAHIIPFKLDQEDAVNAMDEAFSKRLFAPASFLDEKTLQALKGHYVPFYLYDYEVNAQMSGQGTKVRSWRSGNYTYTETSYYEVVRRIRAEYENIPVDASIKMPDEIMDLLEPFDYKDFKEFQPTFMSGFFGEIYNNVASFFEERAKKKVKSSVETIMSESVTGYSTFRKEFTDIKEGEGKSEYVLLPVWKYTYAYGGKDYDYYVNGQNGKVVGTTPISAKKVIGYGLTCSLLWFLILNGGIMIARLLMGV